MTDLYPLLRPMLRRLPAEAAHRLSVRAMQFGAGRFLADRAASEPDPPILRQRIWGLDFANPVGLAAGYDKDGRACGAMLALGFGFVEAGTVTPRPQPGNPKPRLFRLEEDGGAINRMGFNSGGLDALVARLSRHKRRGIVGVNLGKNRDSGDAVADYEEGIRRTAGLADYLVVNISSPNTPGLRDLQARGALDSLLRRLIDTRSGLSRRVPLLLKIAPDLTTDERRDVALVALDTGIDGLIISNTTIARPGGLRSRHADETGGLSGRPLFAASTALLSDMYRLTQGRLPLVGVGGVAGAADALAKIRVGASLVQLYTALIFEGPALVGRLKTDLAELLRRGGFDWVGSAVGSAHPPTSTAAIRAAQTASSRR
ncbi:MAG TPA: quinone-dependent dihydroorotate dehydrogenase [Stellaceae bacterium]|jgi:dihydroorotate dehydrogenase|nr:quinone-dependent dihydroorotate dehydrogenase [Stellaceae bacterium]